MIASRLFQTNRAVIACAVSIAAICAPSTARAEFGCGPGTSANLSSLVDEIAAMPEGGWMRANANRYDEVWAPRSLRPLSSGIESTPSKIIQAWSSFAWDCRRGDLLIYGGGHANYSGNDTYRWRATTRRWERMSLPSEIRIDEMGNTTAVDGPFAAPPAAHTYDNNIYLPFVDRLLVLGGSAFNNGGAFEMATGPDSERFTGPYLFDPTKADGSKVGGTTGSHVKREAPYPEILGGMMWENRDLYSLLPLSSLPSNHTSGTTAYAGNGSDDVVLFTARQGLGTAQHLFRYELPDPFDATKDRVTRIGRYVSGIAGRGAGAYDPDANLFVRNTISSTGSAFYFWDLTKVATDNPNVVFAPRDLSGTWKYDRGYGMDYDPTRGQYLLWGGTSEVWALRAPATLSSKGWTIERTPPTPSGSTPMSSYEGSTLESGGGVLGKWKYIPELDAFVGLQDTSAGNIWIYKPVGWVRPGTVPPPTLNLTASAEKLFSGDSLTISWRSKAATNCIADGGWVGTRATSGSITFTGLTASASYGLTCTGSGGTVRRAASVVVDPVGPPTIDPIAGDACLNNAETSAGISVRGTGKAGATVTLGIAELTRNAAVEASGFWRIEVSATELASLPEGTLTATAKQAITMLDYSPTASASFVKDTIAPSNTSSIPQLNSTSDTGASSSDALTRDSTPTYQGTASATSLPVALLIDGAVVRITKSGSGGKWTATAPTLTSGIHVVSSAVSDACGNLGQVSDGAQLEIDRTAPSLVVSDIATDNRINLLETQRSVHVSGTADASAVLTLQVTAGSTVLLKRTTVSSGSWSVTLLASEVQSLPEGTLSFTVSASDEAGNSRSVKRTVTKDTAVGTPVLNPITGDDIITAAERSTTITVTGRAEAASKVTLAFGATTRTKTVSSSGDWSIDLANYVLRSLPIGTVQFVVTSTDSAGNTSTPATRQVNITESN